MTRPSGWDIRPSGGAGPRSRPRKMAAMPPLVPPRVRWYLERARVMPPGEYVHRARQAALIARDRVRGPAPAPDVPRPADGWPRPVGAPALCEPADVEAVLAIPGARDAARERGEALLEGRVRFFGSPEAVVGPDPDWHRDAVADARLARAPLERREPPGAGPRPQVDLGARPPPAHRHARPRLAAHRRPPLRRGGGAADRRLPGPVPARRRHPLAQRAGAGDPPHLVGVDGGAAARVRRADRRVPRGAPALGRRAPGPSGAPPLPVLVRQQPPGRRGGRPGGGRAVLPRGAALRAEHDRGRDGRAHRRARRAGAPRRGGRGAGRRATTASSWTSGWRRWRACARSGRPCPTSSPARWRASPASSARSRATAGRCRGSATRTTGWASTWAPPPTSATGSAPGCAPPAPCSARGCRAWTPASTRRRSGSRAPAAPPRRPPRPPPCPAAPSSPTGATPCCAPATTRGEVRAVLDAGPMGLEPMAAHGHADLLAVCLAVDGEEALVDPGTFTYFGEERWRRYGAPPARTPPSRIDGRDHAEPAGRFLWRSRPAAVLEEVTSTDDRIEAVGAPRRLRPRAPPPPRRAGGPRADGGRRDHRPGRRPRRGAALAPAAGVGGAARATAGRGATATGASRSPWTAPPPRWSRATRSGPLGFRSLGLEHREPSPTIVARVRATLPVTLTTRIAAGGP